MSNLRNINYDKKLLKVMSINSLSVVIRLISGFILSKMIAIFIGPQGIALVGNLRSFLTSIQSIASFGIQKGVIKYVSEYKNEPNELEKIISTTFFLGVLSAISVSVILIFFANFFSIYIFNSIEYVLLIRVLGIGLCMQVLNFLYLGIINGYSKYKLFTILNIVTSILGLGISVFSIWKYEVLGLLYAIIIIPSISLIVSFFIAFKQFNLFSLINKSSFDKSYFKKFSEYSIMALLTAVIIPPTLIAIRNHVVKVDGLMNMGYWESMNRVSNYYLVFITSLLTLYLYPKLSKANTKKELRNVLMSFYKTIMPIVLIGLFLLYFFREEVINVLFSKTFMPMEILFSWQLLGDLFRILSAVLAFQFMAKKMTKDYVITEVLSALIWYFSSIYFINVFGYLGASIGYLVCYFSYFILLLIWFRKQLFF